MFKQILITIVILVTVIIISFFIIKRIHLFVYKLILTKGVLKYNISGTIKQFLDNYSNEFNISYLNLLKSEKNVLFYTDTVWTTKNNNYIHSLKEDKYYIIDKGYYYYIDSMDNFKIFINNINTEVKIKLFDYSNNYSRLNFI
jgi:hypothetical protein